MNTSVRRILAALDEGATSETVLRAARWIAEASGLPVEAVHVKEVNPEGGSEPVENSVPVRVLDGPVPAGLLGAVEDPGVCVVVLCARRTLGRPMGRTAAHVLEHTTKPALVVSPLVPTGGPLRVVLLPLEGGEPPSEPRLAAAWPLLVPGVELVALHVFTDMTRPRMLDRPYRDLELIGREFLSSHLPRTTRIELRAGRVAACVAEVADEVSADMIILTWSQDSSAGRAPVVQEILGAATLPVLLLPRAEAGGDRIRRVATSAAHGDEDESP